MQQHLSHWHLQLCQCFSGIEWETLDLIEQKRHRVGFDGIYPSPNKHRTWKPPYCFGKESSNPQFMTGSMLVGAWCNCCKTGNWHHNSLCPWWKFLEWFTHKSGSKMVYITVDITDIYSTYIYILYYVRIYIVYIKYIYMYYIRYWHIITIISLDILASSLQRLSQLDPPTKTHNPNPRSYDCHTDLPWHGLNSAIFWVKNAEGLFPWTGL